MYVFKDYCYLTNNRFAYLKDIKSNDVEFEMKYYNFVPTYDKWCLYCNKKDVNLRCGNCKFIYYCDKECQKKSWNIHKKHCNRDLFILCATCGFNDIKLKCDDCPVKFCSEECKDRLMKSHKEYGDCKKFSILNK